MRDAPRENPIFEKMTCQVLITFLFILDDFEVPGGTKNGRIFVVIFEKLAFRSRHSKKIDILGNLVFATIPDEHM